VSRGFLFLHNEARALGRNTAALASRPGAPRRFRRRRVQAGHVSRPRRREGRAGRGRIPRLEQVDRLVSEQKFDEAQKKVDAILAAAQKRGDEENWTRALVRARALEIGLHGYETAVRFLKENKWPSGLLSRVTLDLFYGQTLVTYARAYSWEIGQREKVESSSTGDLKAGPRANLCGGGKEYLDAWGKRGELGSTLVGRLSEYLEGGTYPPRSAERCATRSPTCWSSFWRHHGLDSPPVQRGPPLDLSRLLGQEGAAAQGQLEKPEIHPVEKFVAVLADLEAWHAAAGRRGAELEARLERLRRLHAAFTQERDRGAIRRFLEERLARSRDIPWWSAGMATFAQFLEAEDAPDNLIRALAAARAGAKAYPIRPAAGSAIDRRRDFGSRLSARIHVRRCSGRPSIQVTHKNLPALHFAPIRWIGAAARVGHRLQPAAGGRKPRNSSAL